MTTKQSKRMVLVVLALAAVVLTIISFVQHLQAGERFKAFMSGLGVVVFGGWLWYYIRRYKKGV